MDLKNAIGDLAYWIGGDRPYLEAFIDGHGIDLADLRTMLDRVDRFYRNRDLPSGHSLELSLKPLTRSDALVPQPTIFPNPGLQPFQVGTREDLLDLFRLSVTAEIEGSDCRVDGGVQGS